MNDYKESDLIETNGTAQIYSNGLGPLEERVAYARSILDNEELEEKYLTAAKAFLQDVQQEYFEACLSHITDNTRYDVV